MLELENDVNCSFVMNDPGAEYNLVLAAVWSFLEFGHTVHPRTRLPPLLHGWWVISLERFRDTLALQHRAVQKRGEHDGVSRILEVDALETTKAVLIARRLDDAVHG